jgi:hypothetical protein
VIAAQCAQPGLGGHHVGVELAQPGAQLALGSFQLLFGDLVGLQLGAESGELLARQVHAECGELRHHVAVAPGGVGLLLQRAELTAHLAQQVLQPGEVALGVGQPPLGLLLAAAELEDARGLLDDQPSFFGSGVQHRVDLALADDHVLLAAHTRVAQELLDVEQPARHAVDGVLAVSGAEQRAGDRDLGELDRQRPGAVVDGERHLGATQGGTLLGAGEDDVVHLLGAHRARGLGAEHPADGVDHVGLAAAVGADHDGDAGFHHQGGGVGEGLEALDGERSQEHGNSGGTGPNGRLRPGRPRTGRRFGPPAAPWTPRRGSAGTPGRRARTPGVARSTHRACPPGLGTGRRTW